MRYRAGVDPDDQELYELVSWDLPGYGFHIDRRLRRRSLRNHIRSSMTTQGETPIARLRSRA